MLLMRTFSSADTSAVDCLSEMLSSACTTSAVSVVVLFSLRVSMPCVGDMDPADAADASENGRERGTSRWGSNVTFSGSSSSGVGGGKRRSLMASTWFPRRRGSLLLGHLVGQGFRGGCEVVAGGDLEYCSWSTNPKAKASSSTAVVSLSFPDNSVRSARTLRGAEVVLLKEAREKKKVKDQCERRDRGRAAAATSQAKEQESFTRLKWR